MQAFAAEVREVIEGDALTEEVKRELLDKLAVRVVLARDGTATVSGVFAPFTLSLLSTSCLYTGQLPVTFFIDLGGRG